MALARFKFNRGNCFYEREVDGAVIGPGEQEMAELGLPVPPSLRRVRDVSGEFGDRADPRIHTKRHEVMIAKAAVTDE